MRTIETPIRFQRASIWAQGAFLRESSFFNTSRWTQWQMTKPRLSSKLTFKLRISLRLMRLLCGIQDTSWKTSWISPVKNKHLFHYLGSHLVLKSSQELKIQSKSCWVWKRRSLLSNGIGQISCSARMSSSSLMMKQTQLGVWFSKLQCLLCRRSPLSRFKKRARSKREAVWSITQQQLKHTSFKWRKSRI